MSDELEQKVAELRAARTAWHEHNGVPISPTYARFLQAIGDFEDAARAEIARLKARLDQFPLLDAKWLDPECLEGCQSLIHKARIRELELDLAAVLAVLRSKSTDQEWEGMPVGFRAAWAKGQETSDVVDATSTANTEAETLAHRNMADFEGIAAYADSVRRETLAWFDDRERIGKIMHESWSKTKRAQGFHGPNETCTHPDYLKNECRHHFRCNKFHADLIPWEELPEPQKDINRHAFDAVIGAAIRSIAAERTK